MRKNNKKGFTIVELVIVIAVIAILAGVLIPTFANMVDKANKSADLQAATNAFKSYVADNADKDEDMDLYIFVDNDTVYQVTDGKLAQEPMANVPTITPAVAGNDADNDGVYEEGETAPVPEKAGTYELVNTYESCKVYSAD